MIKNSIKPSTIVFTKSSGTPRSLANKYRCSSTVNKSHKELFCVTTPKCVAAFVNSDKIERSAMKASPLVGNNNLVKIDNVVV